MASQQEKDAAYKLLRAFLNKAIRGPNTDAILKALSGPSADLIYNAQAVHDNLFIISSEGRFLDQRLADRGLTRPTNIGLSDDDFKKIGIEVTTRKQVRDLISQILEAVYGFEYTRAFAKAGAVEPYALQDGDTISVSFDDADSVSIRFESSQFQSISNATAQEVADAITRGLRAKGRQGFGTVFNDGLGDYVVLVSPTIGPSSTVTVTGGRAQNELKFPEIKGTTQDASTQVTLTLLAGGIVRATWTGGAAPSFGKVSSGDYAIFTGTGFDPDNRGTFQVVEAVGGIVNEAYVDFINPLGMAETVTIGAPENMTFFNPKRETITSKPTFSAAYQTESRVLEVYLPVLTRIVRRERIDAAYLFDTIPPNPQEQVGSFLYDTTFPYTYSTTSTTTSNLVDSSTGTLIEVSDSSQFPDQSGFVVFGMGTDKEEGPVPYLSRPSNNTIRISPLYNFKNFHPAGTDITLISRNAPVQVDPSGEDYAVYLTDISGGRKYAEELINTVSATGIKILLVLVYPGPIGLGGWQATTEEGKEEWQKIFRD